MIRTEDHLTKIKETQRQISITTSPQRKRDLSKHLKKLWKEYNIALSNIKNTEGMHEEQKRSSVIICGMAHGG